ncbi:D-isomer specific 2-hydroxyacid dehydrogenase [Colletotrichum higginsianum IMI 349063]|uniref:D-isomer specific 2-hydroxyacid dehydrogenase n=1 Tax=Colletotrichum higginsianum (strain IMI 349063) TaxID=759273 RepID=A0A1B7XRE2_COLHI|nr:D-isomer specific 2-hydroxyacid dehydrogenase [Colletotrichum higginsianum IMI 349063]OBR02342.1 D-isomer specific 2-hydroxyacid dehydrogenase [Colletotrichum higginsianum IMI 349063]
MGKPIVLQLGDDIKWNHDLYKDFTSRFEIRRSYSMPRAEFIQALKDKKFGDFFAIYRPFWNTGGEMGNWDKELISLLPSSCKVYASAGAGFDWVDTETLASRGESPPILLLTVDRTRDIRHADSHLHPGIVYCNAAAACTESVADGAIWLILSTFRLFSWSSAAARSGDPDQFVDANKNLGAVSRNPNGFTLGIIGFGRIGRRIAEKAHRSFDMKILYNDVARMPAEAEKGSDATFYGDMSDLLAAADCVIVATPFAGKTLLDAAAIGKMKKGARLINIARGKLVEEEPLVAALKSGHLSAAGLDVHYNEPHVNKELIKMRNVEVLSHNAGASLDAHMGFEKLGMQNIISFAETGKAVTPVNAHLITKSRL